MLFDAASLSLSGLDEIPPVDPTTIDPQLLSSYLFYLQFNGFPETKTMLLPYTGLTSLDSYYYCQTGIPKSIYLSRLGISGQSYCDLYFGKLHTALSELLCENGFCGTPYLILDDSKQIGVIFQAAENSSVTPLELAKKIDQLIQQCYYERWPDIVGRYRNVTALSSRLCGIHGFYDGHKETEMLINLSFFCMTPDILSRQFLDSIKNNADYRSVMAMCRETCNLLGHGNIDFGLTQAKILFLDLLKYSFDMELMRNVLSYIKQFLSIRLTVYQQIDDVNLDLLCSLDSYVTIEECFENLSQIFAGLRPAHMPMVGCSDMVAYAACYIRQNLQREIALQEVSDYVDASPSYLSSIFHQQTGITMKQYQTQARIEKASYLLAHSDKKVTEIASLTGFTNRRYFTATFKRETGVTPQQYRQEAVQCRHDTHVESLH